MSGGLCHQTMRKKGPSYLVGYELAAKASHPVKETQCICAEASSVLELTKFITQKTKKHFDTVDVLRDVEKAPFVENGRNLRDTKCLAIREDRL
jgi:hypothetical protein